MDLKGHVHFIGIGGSGLSAIARVLLERGFTVSGSDRQAAPLLSSLQDAGAQVYVEHRPENVRGADLVIRSSAVQDDNIEVQAAREAGVPVLKRADYLGELMAGHVAVAVAGTHGKTTTTAMIAWMLSELGQDPTFIVGSQVKGLETNARAGQGQVFVIEADEYDGMFLGLAPKVAVVTNLEHDHPDCYPTMTDYNRAFSAFASRVVEDGVLLGCGDDPGAVRLLEEAAANGQKVRSYGLNSSSYAYQGGKLRINEHGGFSFDFLANGSSAGQGGGPVRVHLQVPGVHNVLNGLAALGVAHQLGMDVNGAAQALASFQGTGRRFEEIGEAGGIVVVDDYAHHPSEVRATLSAARARYPGRELWLVWQPHTYSRTRTLLDEFAAAFEEADHLVVTEIYASREAPPADGFSGSTAAAAIRGAQFSPNFFHAEELLLDSLKPGSVLLVLSAGDADQLSRAVLEGLLERSYKDA